jgi:hypothetical protein
MQLTYRGVDFQAPIAGAEAMPSEQTGTFLGKPYAIKQAHATQRQVGVQLTYRGARYSR